VQSAPNTSASTASTYTSSFMARARYKGRIKERQHAACSLYFVVLASQNPNSWCLQPRQQ